MRFSAIILCLLLVPPAAHSSSDDAWEEFNHAVTMKCAKSSGLKDAHVSEVIGFDSTTGKVAVLVSGVYPQTYMKGATGAKLCLYDQLTQKVWLSDAEGWRAPDGR
jgi:hypothetical protein